MSQSADFFESQFQRQVRAGEFALNPFEHLALSYVHGEVLDLGCGLGNLALEAARRGCSVEAIDASPAAIARIRDTARDEQLPVEAIEADLSGFMIGKDYDTIVAIGLLMFFRKTLALRLLKGIQDRVRRGGHTIVNVLVRGTTFMDMFTPGEYYLFRRKELVERFSGWVIETERYEYFPAPVNTMKAFATVIARKP
jgi:tellurite methyltransferase